MTAAIQDILAKELFFIGSFPKSGSTWLRISLNAHPGIACHGEGHFYNNLAPLLEKALREHNALIDTKNRFIFTEFTPFPAFGEDDFRFLLTSAIGLLLTRSHKANEKRWIGEKTPNNVRHFGRLLALFPHAKFPQIVRDGRDCAVSAWFHNMRTNPDETIRRHGTFAHFAEHMAAVWAANVELGLRFQDEHPGASTIIRYEDMHAAPQQTMRAVLTFLGADASDAHVRICLDAGRFERMSGGRAIGVEDRSSFLRLGRPGDWRNRFTARANRRFSTSRGRR